ncbi:hypothetical protein PR048_031571 [Dryococelus australis]|uniref:HTH CENPB-type domain-containing protein n=1 Tax=Dryococelus australis TaxID=614101 RepID=A0ABQ9G6C4_9NEOP|nr:hypothetical protein PR048_031571 [Dryococelus australis]
MSAAALLSFVVSLCSARCRVKCLCDITLWAKSRLQPKLPDHFRSDVVPMIWQSGKRKLTSVSGSNACAYLEVEEKLFVFVMNLRKDGYSVSTEMFQLEACKIAHKLNIKLVKFKESYGWVRRFMKRKQLSIRQRTTLAQKILEEYDKKLLGFQWYVIALRKNKDYLLSQIGNADQTPVWFDMPESMTVSVVDERSVPVKTTGADKQCCTVMLAIAADGHKFPPYLLQPLDVVVNRPFIQTAVQFVDDNKASLQVEG